MKIQNQQLFFLLFFLIASPIAVHAQMDDSRIGIKGGFNASNFYSNDVSDQNMRIGFHVGVFTEIAFAESVSLQPELLLSTKGNRATYNIAGLDGEVKTNLTYIDIPVLVKVTLGETLNLHIGPYFSYLIGANASSDGDLGSGSDDLDRDNFKTWDYGLAGGIGVDLEAVTIGARYNLGLADIAESTAAKAVFDDSKNSVLQAYIAVGF